MTQETAESRSILCPACGYDLRAATEDRCSECGLAIDRASLDRSGIPWAHRRAVGQLRAFIKTIWLMTRDAKSLRNETAKPQDARDAAAFRRRIALLVVAVSILPTMQFIEEDGISDNIVHQQDVFATTPPMPGFWQDILVPWSAGIALPFAVFAYAGLLAVSMTAAPLEIFRTNDMPAEQSETTRAMGNYAAAPLAWLLPAGLAALAIVFIGPRPWPQNYNKLLALLMAFCIIFLVIAIGGTVHRTGQWRARATHSGYATGFAAMGELLLRWSLAAGVFLYVVPWCVGCVAIFIDSFLP